MSDAFLYPEASTALLPFSAMLKAQSTAKQLRPVPARKTNLFRRSESGTSDVAVVWVSFSGVAPVDRSGGGHPQTIVIDEIAENTWSAIGAACFGGADVHAQTIASDEGADDKWSAAGAKLDALASLPDGWNGRLSAAAAAPAKDNARAFLASIVFVGVAPKVQLSASGELGFFWRWPEGIVEINFDAEGGIEVMRLSGSFRMESYQQGRDIGESISWVLQSIAVLANRRGK